MRSFSQILNEVFVTEAHAARTISADPLQSFMFRVVISGLPSSVGFQKVSGISREVGVVEYLENMYAHKHKLPGRETVGEITFERGMYADAALQALYESVFNNDNCRSQVQLQILDRFNNIRRTFTFEECWFSKYEVGDMDATSDDVLIETLTMQCESIHG